MQSDQSLTCILVGAGSLLVRCAEQLLQEHWRIVAVVSEDAVVQSWANQKAIATHTSLQSVPAEPTWATAVDVTEAVEAAKTAKAGVDYLFCIGLAAPLPEAWLQWARQGTINCHDSCLPSYAGYNAPAWALMRGERQHGVVWHRVAPSDSSQEWSDRDFYSGSVLAQVGVTIEPQETVLTLNAKCYEAAWTGFGQLLPQLSEEASSEEVSLEKTSLEKTSTTAIAPATNLALDSNHPSHPVVQNSSTDYFSVTARPSAAAILDFQRPAASLSALVRGLAFGQGYINPLTVPKVWLGEAAVYGVKRLQVVPHRPRFEMSGETSLATLPPPGTIVSWTNEQLRVRTVTDDVLLSGWTTLTGEAVTIQQLVTQHQLVEGQILPLLSLEDAQALQQSSEAIATTEKAWVDCLDQRHPLRLGAIAASSSSVVGPKIDELPFTLPAEVQQAIDADINADAEQTNVSSLQWLTAAWGLFLARLSGEGYGDLDIPVGVGDRALSTSTAAATQLDKTLYASHVPLMIRADLEQTFSQNLRRIQQTWMQRQAQGTYPLDLWMRQPNLQQQVAQLAPALPIAVQVEDAVDPAAITDTIADAITAAWPEGRKLLWVFQENEPEVGQSQRQSQRQSQQQSQRQDLTWYYDRHQLDPKALTRLQSQFTAFLKGIVQQPDRPLWQQPLLTEPEYQRVVEDWNQTTADYDWNLCIHELFEQQASATPDCIALKYQQQTLTYAALNQRANQLAHFLRSRGLQPEDCVGVHLDRSLDMVVALLGVLKSGAAYVPMDPSYPQERLAWMREDAAPKLILTQAHLLDRVPGGATDSICLDVDWKTAIAPHSQENPSPLATPANLAYIIYTSGSTGRPKGVMIEHRSLTNLSQAVIHDYAIGCDIVLEFASISFDMAVEEIYPCLISGGMLVIRTAEMIQSVTEFLAQCQQLGVTVLSLPTAYWHLVVSELKADEQLRIPDSVRVVLIGGEAANPKRVVQWQQMCHRTGCRAQLLNTYGPTEATVDSTAYHFELPSAEQLDPNDPPAVPIGYPISNVTNYVLDNHQQPVPMGAVGELCVGGAGVARGYLNRPDLTAERFVADPFAADPQARLYRTGDLVRHRADGAIEYMGRIDNQVKIRGFRIELGEIEAVLSQHPTVKDAVVIVREDVPGQKQLVAYCVPQAGEAIAPTVLRESLDKTLPDYMVPKAFVSLSAFPMTPNEKVDRKALPKPDFTALLNSGDTPTPLQTPTEKQLADIWKSILGVPVVGRTDSFLELGGDSLTAMRLFMQIERVFNQKLSLSTLFQYPTVQGLARVIAGDRAALPKTSIVPLQSQGSQPPMFFVNCAQDANRLATYVGDDYPFYGLNIFGTTDRLSENLETLTLTRMAQIFIEDMRRVQPQGPYYLSSYCGDTRLAVELAHELRRQGETVALLALIDPWWNDDPPTLAYHIQNLRYFGINYVVEKAREKLTLWRSDLTLAVERGKTNWRRRFSRQAPSSKDQDIALYGAFWQASHVYQAPAYDGNVIVLLSEELRLDKTGELDEVWRAFPSNYPVYRIPGYHHEIFDEPGIKLIGEYLRQSIDKAVVRNGLVEGRSPSSEI